MEKRTPACPLTKIKTLVKNGKVRMTASAVSGAAELGINRQGVVAVVMALSSSDFHKSMTTYADHRLWQDVYLPMTDMGRLYVKLTVSDGLLIISFKEA